MSFTIPPSPPARPNRCQLFGPASNTKLFEKMAASAADVVNLDLEDSVSPSDKEMARACAIKAIDGVKPENDDQKVGLHIVRKALQTPARQIAIPWPWPRIPGATM